MRNLKSICVFCGSNPGANGAYLHAATSLGRTLGEKNIKLIFGGGKIGMMGAVADAVLESGGEVTGVIPDFLADRELAHPGVKEMLIVETMHARKRSMADLADGFIALPGGYGTMDELFEIITWSQLGLHSKPVGLLNVGGYYDELILFFDKMVKGGFVSVANRELLIADGEIGSLLTKMESYEAPDRRSWLDRTKV